LALLIKRSTAALAAIALAAAGFVASSAPQADAAPTVAFAQRFQANANGAIISIGNNLLTCPTSASNCASAQAGTALANNAFAMVNLDADSDASTFNSSSATLALPDGFQVLWAGLYWGARLNAGSNGSAASGTRTQMLLKVPGTSSYQTINSAQEFGPNPSSSNAYQEFADITALVKAAGNGAYWGANVVAGTGADRYAGWAMTVVYQAPGLPLRNLTVFDGFEYISSGSTKTITVSGFQAPTSGQVDTQLTMVAYEGDLPTTGDYTKFNDTQLASAISPGSNFFNSTDDTNGASVTARTPAYRNMLGFDIKNIGASGAVQNGDTSATFTFSSNGDVYFPGVLGMAINLYAPDFTASTKTVTNTSGASGTKPGDTLQYTIAYSNTGQDAADGVVSSDQLPAGVDYVYGSLVLVSSPDPCVVTPAHISDYGTSYGYYDASTRTVSINLGGDKTATCGSATANRPTIWSTSGSHGGQLQPGDTQYYQFQVKVLPAAGGTVLSNIASLAYTTDTTHLTAEYDTPPATITVSRLADLSITKSMTPSPAIAGQAGTTTLTVTNNGPNTATNVVVTDAIPATYEATSVVSSTGTSCALPVSGAVSCGIGDLASGATATVTIQGLPDSATTDTTLTNIAQVTTDSVDPDMSNNVATVSIPMTHQADLKITKTPSTISAAAGQTITWRLTVTNQCPSPATGTCLSDATDVTITDSVADSSKLVLLSATGGTGAGGTQGDQAVTCPGTLTSNATVQCTLANALGPGETATVTVTGYVPANVAAGASGVANNASVTSATFDPAQADNLTTATVTVAAPVADLGVVKTGPATAVAGNTIRYTVKVTNYGPSDAAGATLTDTLPGGLSFGPGATATSDHGSCSIGGNTLTCQLGTLGGPATPTSGAGAVATVTITGVVVASSATGSVTNTATAASSAAEPAGDPHPNTATATTTVTRQSDIALSKTSTVVTVPDPGSGDTVPYSITVTNLGPSDATGVTMTDTLPTDVLAYVTGSATPSQGSCTEPSGATLNCTIGALTAGASATITLTMQEAGLYTSGTKPASFQQTATAGATPDDPDNSNNTATWTNSGSDQADLSITKTSSGIVAGGTSVPNSGYYDLTVSNAGPNQATFPVITDTLPAGLTIVTASLPAECNASGQTVTCTKSADLASGGTWGPLRIPFQVGAVARGTTLTNTATVSSVTGDPTQANNTASVTDTVRHVADVEVDSFTLTPTGSYTGPGSTWQVAIHVVNNGPSVAEAVQVLSNVAVTSLIDPSTLPSYCHAVNQELVCDVSQEPSVQAAGGLQPSAALTINFNFQVAPSDAPGSFPACAPADYDPSTGPTCANPGGWAQASTTTTESDYTNNGLTAGITVAAARTDLGLTKTALSTIPNGDGHPAYIAGAKFGYQVDLTARADAADAAGVVVTDTLPDGFHATQVNPAQGTCSISDTGTGTDNLITCQLGTVAAGQGSTANVVTLYIYGDIDDDVTAEISSDGGAVNQATATSTTPNLSGAATNLSAQVADDVIQQADLQQYKTADSTTFYAGGSVGYTLTTVNAGPSAVEDAVVTDTLPVGVVPALANSAANSGDADYLELASPPNSPHCFVDRLPTSPQDPASDTNTNPYVVTCQVGHIDAGASVSVRVVGTTDPRDLRPYWCPGQDPSTDPEETCLDEEPPADPSTEHPRTLTNTAVVSSATATDTMTLNNTANNATLLQVMADIAVTASVDINTPAAGTDVKFTLTGVNLGPSTADHPVTDAVFPKGFVINCPDGPANSCAAVNIPTMDCSISHTGSGLDVVYSVHCVGWPQTPYRDSFLPNFTIPGTVTAHIPDDIPAGSYTSTNITTTTTPESDYSNNSAPATVNVVTVADTSITKTLVSPNPLVVGRPATYRLTAYNAGPSVARDVTISDAVPEGTSLISAQVVGGATCPAPDVRDINQVVNCSVGTIEPGESASVEIVFDVPKDYTGTLCNAALVGSGALDPSSGDNEAQACHAANQPPATDVGVRIYPYLDEVVHDGDLANYTAIVENNGPAATEGTKVTFTLPSGLTGATVTWSSSSAGTHPAATCVAMGNVVTCDIGDLPVGAMVVYSISGRASGAVGTLLEVQAVVTHYDIDTDPANDRSEATVVIQAPPPTSPTPTGSPTPPTGSPTPPTPPGSSTPPPTGSPSPNPGGGLPVMGSDALGLAIWALVIVLLGGGLRAGTAIRRRYQD
jgi:uncharacterized repeat protein (TIGR01451 family)